MRYEDLLQIIQKAANTSCRIKITFRPDATKDLPVFLELYRYDMISINYVDKMILSSVATIDDWGDDKNRTVVMSFGHKFNTHIFTDRMSPALEKAEIVPLD